MVRVQRSNVSTVPKATAHPSKCAGTPAIIAPRSVKILGTGADATGVDLLHTGAADQVTPSALHKWRRELIHADRTFD